MIIIIIVFIIIVNIIIRLSLFDLDGDDEISSSEFLALVYNNKNLKIIEPFFHLQRRLRESTLGNGRYLINRIHRITLSHITKKNQNK